jgi:hypothetical protein
MIGGEHTSRLLLPIGAENAFFRITNGGITEGEFSFAADDSGFEYIAEEIIGQGATGFAVDALSFFAKPSPATSSILLRRVQCLDRRRNVHLKALAVLKPIIDELGTPTNNYGDIVHSWIGPAVVALNEKRDEAERQADHSVFQLYASLYHLLLGIRYHLQIDIDIARTWSAAQRLYSRCHTSEARTNLSFISGLLASYRKTDVGGLVVAVASNTNDLVASFEEFVDDEIYRQFSVERHSLGILIQVKHALSQTKRLARRLIRKKHFARFFSYGVKTVSLAVAAPIPNSELAEVLLSDKYLPPILSLEKSLLRARNAWTTQSPSTVLSFEAEMFQRGPRVTSPKSRTYLAPELRVTYDIYDFLDMFTFNDLPRPDEPGVRRAFEDYWNANLTSPVRCQLHDTEADISAITVEWTSNELAFRIRTCCEDAAERALITMLSNKN